MTGNSPSKCGWRETQLWRNRSCGGGAAGCRCPYLFSSARGAGLTGGVPALDAAAGEEADGAAGGVVAGVGVAAGLEAVVVLLAGAASTDFSGVVAAVGAPPSVDGVVGACSGVTGGAAAGTSSKTLFVACLAVPRVRLNEVNMKTIAVAVVNLVRKFPAPELPKIVWLEPPNTALTSDPFPVWRRTTMTKKMQARM
jgi:hypothetical protein